MAEENKNIPVPPRVAAINAEVAASPIPGISQAPSAFTPESITGDTQLNQIPDQGVTTDGAGVGGQAVAVGEQTKADILQAETDAAATTAETEKKSALTKISDLVKKKTGILETKGEVKKEFGVGEKLQEFTDYTNEIEALDRAHTNELRALEGQVGMTVAGKRDAQAAINRKHNFAKADLAILQTAANRNFLTAKQLADDKIQAQLEPIDLQLDFLDKYISINSADWSADKRNAFNLRVDKVQAERDAEEARLKRISDMKNDILENIFNSDLDPVTKKQTAQNIMGQDSVNDLIETGGQFLVTPDTEIRVVDGRTVQIDKRTGRILKVISEGGGLGFSSEFGSGDLENEVREFIHGEDGVLKKINAGTMTADEAFAQIRGLWRPSEASDKGIRQLLGIEEPIGEEIGGGVGVSELRAKQSTDIPAKESQVVKGVRNAFSSISLGAQEIADFFINR